MILVQYIAGISSIKKSIPSETKIAEYYKKKCFFFHVSFLPELVHGVAHKTVFLEAVLLFVIEKHKGKNVA